MAQQKLRLILVRDGSHIHVVRVAARTLDKLRRDMHIRDLLKGTVVAILVQIAGVFANIIFSIVLARALGPELAGVFFLGMMFLFIAQIAGGLGLDNAVMRFVAESHAGNNNEAADAIWRQSMATTLAFSSVLGVCVVLSRGWISGALNAPELEYVLLWVGIGIPPSSLLLVNSSALKGIKKIGSSMAYQGAVKSAIAILLILLVFRHDGVIGATKAFVFATVFALILSVIVWDRSIAHRGHFRGFDYARLMRTALPLVSVSMMMLVVRWTDTLMLGYLASPKEVGLYNIAFRISNLANFFLVAISAVASPKIAAMYNSGELVALTRLVRVAGLFTAVCAAPFLILVLWLPSWLLAFFGAEFVDASLALRILVLGHYCCAAAGPLVAVLAMTGLERQMRNAISLMALFNFVLNWFLIPRYGIEGAAISSTVGFVVINAVYLSLIAKKRGIHIVPILKRGS